MNQITRHSKSRIVERMDTISSFQEAKKVAKQAWSSGKTIDRFQGYPNLYNYLVQKANYSRSNSLRVYRNTIFIWRGKKHVLVTAYPIPENFQDEMRRKEKQK